MCDAGGSIEHFACRRMCVCVLGGGGGGIVSHVRVFVFLFLKSVQHLSLMDSCLAK